MVRPARHEHVRPHLRRVELTLLRLVREGLLNAKRAETAAVRAATSDNVIEDSRQYAYLRMKEHAVARRTDQQAEARSSSRSSRCSRADSAVKEGAAARAPRHQPHRTCGAHRPKPPAPALGSFTVAG